MNLDYEGNSWNSFWNSVGNWFSNTFGAYVDLSQNVASYVEDYVFVGYESGANYGETLGDDSKPVSVFAANASEWWKFWEYQVGYSVNIGEFSCSYSVGIGDTNSSIGWKDTTLDFQSGINKIGMGLSHTSNNITTYSQYYIRTLPTAVAVLACIYAPQLLPAVGGLPAYR